MSDRVTDADDAAHHESDGPGHTVGVAQEFIVGLEACWREVALHALHQRERSTTQHRVGCAELCEELHRCIGGCCAVELCTKRAERGGCFGRAGCLVHGIVYAAAEAVDDGAPAERFWREETGGETVGLGARRERRDSICECCFAGCGAGLERGRHLFGEARLTEGSGMRCASERSGSVCSKTLAPQRTPGTPAPGWVEAPAKKRLVTSSDLL